MREIDIKNMKTFLTKGLSEVNDFESKVAYNAAIFILKMLDLDKSSVLVDTSKSKDLGKELLHRLKNFSYASIDSKVKKVMGDNVLKIKAPRTWVYREFNPNQMVWMVKDHPHNKRSSHMGISEELNKIADMLDGLSKTKTAYGLFAIGDLIICLNPVEPLCKGLKYRVVQFPTPGYITVEDIHGCLIGNYKAERFCKDNNEA